MCDYIGDITLRVKIQDKSCNGLKTPPFMGNVNSGVFFTLLINFSLTSTDQTVKNKIYVPDDNRNWLKISQ